MEIPSEFSPAPSYPPKSTSNEQKQYYDRAAKLGIEIITAGWQQNAIKAATKLDGKSIAKIAKTGGKLDRDFIVSENWSQLTAIGDDYKLGVWLKKQKDNYGDMLFCRKTDPLELKNLCGSDTYKEQEAKLRKGLTEWSKKIVFNEPEKTDVGNISDVRKTIERVNEKS